MTASSSFSLYENRVLVDVRRCEVYLPNTLESLEIVHLKNSPPRNT